MSRQFGSRRSPDAWASAHDRARVRIAERMDEPLEPAESAWLDAHLADCSSCREIDVAYRNDREGLRAMRVVPPPRDLWARTSAALDAEQARSGGGRRTRSARRQTGSSVLGFPRNRWAPLGALGSIAAVMVVGFLLGNMLILAPTRSPSIAQAPSATPNLVPTSIPIAQTDVSWVAQNPDGSIVLRQTAVSDVCPAGDTSGCVPVDQNASNVATLSVKPKSVHQSPTSGQMVIIGPVAGSSGQSLYVVNVGKSPAPTASVVPTASATTTVAPTTGATSPAASSSPTASTATTPEPSPSHTPKPTATATIVPNVTPAPTAASVIALATDVGVLNADTAAYSPDGAWFAFTAR
ncbi:MAG TPA: zf-HC2 domain-containing protein, partial [Candidatus Limnocylindrales bacterium]